MQSGAAGAPKLTTPSFPRECGFDRTRPTVPAFVGCPSRRRSEWFTNTLIAGLRAPTATATVPDGGDIAGSELVLQNFNNLRSATDHNGERIIGPDGL